ncbi:hypothetical protein [Chamaesiphon sp. OTE_75_metabat_556]|nr:hypothetical protein [Chamaesiphon sp. OTE_75_metabat_556]
MFYSIASIEIRLAVLSYMVRFEAEHVDPNTGARKDSESIGRSHPIELLL